VQAEGSKAIRIGTGGLEGDKLGFVWVDAEAVSYEPVCDAKEPICAFVDDSTISAKVQKVGKGLPRQRWPLPRQSYDYTGCGLTYTRAYKASTTLPLFETFADA